MGQHSYYPGRVGMIKWLAEEQQRDLADALCNGNSTAYTDFTGCMAHAQLEYL